MAGARLPRARWPRRISYEVLPHARRSGYTCLRHESAGGMACAKRPLDRPKVSVPAVPDETATSTVRHFYTSRFSQSKSVHRGPSDRARTTCCSRRQTKWELAVIRRQPWPGLHRQRDQAGSPAFGTEDCRRGPLQHRSHTLRCPARGRASAFRSIGRGATHQKQPHRRLRNCNGPLNRCSSRAPSRRGRLIARRHTLGPGAKTRPPLFCEAPR